MDKETKWDKGKFSKSKPISDEDKRAIAEYYQAGLKTAKSSEELFAELAERYDRSSRQIQRYIAQVRAWEPTKSIINEGQQELPRMTRVNQKSYEETPHKQKMQELAERLIGEISLPWILSSFIVELKPQRILYADSRGHMQYSPIIIAENEKISIEISIEGKGEIDHLHKGLRSHLETGGFSEVLGEIDSWKNGVGQIFEKWHDFLKVAMREIKGQVKIPDDKVERNEKAGYKVSFFTSVCTDAVNIARGNPPVTDSSYYREALTNNLWLLIRYNHGGIYVANTEIGAKRCQGIHRALALRLSGTERAKETATLYLELEQTGKKIRERLQKFTDMERVPGYCELCSR